MNKENFTAMVNKYAGFFVSDDYPWTVSDILDELKGYRVMQDFSDMTDKEFWRFSYSVAAKYIEVKIKGKAL